MSKLRVAAWQVVAALGCFAFAGACAAQADDAVSSPESLKAAFLYHFAGYVEWPPQADRSGKIVIGVIGADEIARQLDEILPGRKIGNRPVSLRRLRHGEDLSGVNILFIGRAARDLTGILHAARGLPILLVTDTEHALERGSMINFLVMDDRVRFEISESAANAAGLKLSSRLLAVATRVKSSGLQFNTVPPLVARSVPQLTRHKSPITSHFPSKAARSAGIIGRSASSRPAPASASSATHRNT